MIKRLKTILNHSASVGVDNWQCEIHQSSMDRTEHCVDKEWNTVSKCIFPSSKGANRLQTAHFELTKTFTYAWILSHKQRCQLSQEEHLGPPDNKTKFKMVARTFNRCIRMHRDAFWRLKWMVWCCMWISVFPNIWPYQVHRWVRKWSKASKCSLVGWIYPVIRHGYHFEVFWVGSMKL